MHGGPGFDHTVYRPGIDPLADRLTLIYDDHRGNGRSGRSSLDSITMKRLADDAADLLDALAIEDAIVLGHSDGSFVALEIALRHPQPLRGPGGAQYRPRATGRHRIPGPPPGDPPRPTSSRPCRKSPTPTPAAFARVLMHYHLRHIPPEAVEPLLADTIFSVAAPLDESAGRRELG